MLAAVWGCRSEHDLQQDVNIPVIQWGDTQHLSLAFNLNSIEADVRSICTYLSKKKKKKWTNYNDVKFSDGSR